MQVVDIGSGKGYVGEWLSSKRKVKVIGVDSSAECSRGALKRIGDISKANKHTIKGLVSLDSVTNTVSSETMSSGMTDVLQRNCSDSSDVLSVKEHNESRLIYVKFSFDNEPETKKKLTEIVENYLNDDGGGQVCCIFILFNCAPPL